MHHETKVANYLLAVFSAMALVLLSLPLSRPVRSFKACAVYLLNPAAYHGAKGVERLASIPEGVSRLLSVDIDNQNLRAEARQSLLLRTETEALRRENQRLAEALGLKVASASRQPIWARVMERDPQHWYRSFMVDVGAEQGVGVNDPVLGRKGDLLAAVGRIVETRKDSAVVLLITDELSSVAAYLSSSRLEGLIQGQGNARLRMNYLNSETPLRDNDLVYTSPASATFPVEVMIGTVVKIHPPDPFLTFQSVEVKPSVEAAALEEVLILRTPKPGAAPSRENAL